LGFGGLITTDALVMGAIARRYGIEESAVLAVLAGADILLMPLDAEVVVNAVCAAVAAGRISEQRIDESLRRIEAAKAKVFPKKEMPREVSPNPSYYLYEKLEQPDARETAAEILRHSLRCGGLLPLGQGEGRLRNLILVDDLLNCRFLGNHTPAIAIPQQRGYQLQIIDSNSPSFGAEYLSDDFAATMLQLFIRGNPFRQLGTAIEVAKELLKRLLRNSELCAFVIYGSPYTLELFVSDLPLGLPYVFCYGQMSEAQAVALEILFGGLPKKED
jgi:beta-glucosidase